ncbi:hypothetical protein KR018_000322, partial [Drosophila ironensis]
NSSVCITNDNEILTERQKCDGIVDCPDREDESFELCYAKECNIDQYRCFYGGCIDENLICDEKPDCWDESDEKNCEDSVKFIWHINVCLLSDTTNLLVAEDFTTGTTYRSNASVPDRTQVQLRCTKDHSISGSVSNVCDGDHWRFQLAECVPQCQHFASLDYSSQCSHNKHLVDCDKILHPVGTRMNITCAPGFVQKGQSQEQGVKVCSQNGSWVVEQPLPKCQSICGHWLRTSAPAPWEVSVFRRGHSPVFNFVCPATILSPYFLLTSEHCFRNTSIISVPATEPVLYTVAEGPRYGHSFRTDELHPYKLHNVSVIYNVT